MKAIHYVTLCAVAWSFTFPAATVSSAAEGGGIFNPFAKKTESSEPTNQPPPQTSSRVSARVGDTETEANEEPGFKWPTLPKPKMPAMPKLSLPSLTTEKKMPRTVPHHSSEPEESTWNKVSTGTKTFFTKTKHTLMPWTNDEQAETTVRKPTPPRRTPPKTSARTKSSGTEEKKGIFSWFSKRDEDEGPRTVNEFLSQKRP